MKLFLYCISILMLLLPLQVFAAPLKSPVPTLKSTKTETIKHTKETTSDKPAEKVSSTDATVTESDPKPPLVQPPPASQQFLTIPNPANFKPAISRVGKYQLQRPLAFGNNPYESLTNIDDISLIYINGKRLLATNLLDDNDSYHYRSSQKLPELPNSKLLLIWQLPSQGGSLWTCKLSKLDDFQGSRYMLKALTQVANNSYELLFLLPAQDFKTYLPEMLYSISSFSL